MLKKNIQLGSDGQNAMAENKGLLLMKPLALHKALCSTNISLQFWNNLILNLVTSPVFLLCRWFSIQDESLVHLCFVDSTTNVQKIGGQEKGQLANAI
jgi:hypothetical protein